MIYCGRGTTIHPNTKKVIDGHRFREVGKPAQSNRCNSWWSEGNLISHVKDGRMVLQTT
jgi:hypothetical protein